MGRGARPFAIIALAVVAAAALLAVVVRRPVTAAEVSPPVVVTGSTSLAQPLNTPLRGLTREIYHGIRGALWFVYYALDAWGRWVVRGLCFVGVALLIGLLDRNLLAAWRQEGVRVLRTYVPMMLYVYVRLFFDRRVRLVAKLLLVAGVAYGVQRFDLVPDRDFVPGYLEDVLFIGVAMRFFLYCSPTAAIEQYAAQAVNFRRRLVTF